MGVVYLVRHGQASFGAADYDQLSETGVAQSRVLGETLRPRMPRVDAVITGTLVRHRQTADACLAAMGVKLDARRSAAFDEFDMDEIIVRYEPKYEDRTVLMQDIATAPEPRRAFQELFSLAVARWVSGRHDDDYKEPWRAFRERCIRGMEELIRELGASKNALVFTSGGPITAICQELLRTPDEHAFRLNTALANCGVTKVVYSERTRFLSTLNEHGHFEGTQRALLTYR
ncbi:histidine phosphatase family protein [Pyxidicoccus fallax]|uniref:Histidine phosphatase family protein n=1 Tax=Pyxidicoccus fallax TaxID=394095 RepID=A0A848LKS5_9BACT|nr:histidine phosphatase family protein [Pyxidicoccus fallax]NMO18328.1 histidine phosphatase family protein [Pyxidicoccus fallax]NPC85270.1 histidine phosphatase family protein [Pyxidicoccus fallax]